MNSAVVIAGAVNILIGNTFFIPSGSTDHLFVVIDIQMIGGKQTALLVPFETAFSKCDQACLLGVGDHPFIKHPTFVGYSHCRSDDIVSIAACYFKAGNPVTLAVLQKIKAGYQNSKRVPKHIRNDWG